MAKFKPSDRIAIHKRGKPSLYGTVYKVGENKAHGYYYIDFDNGDRLLVGEKELATLPTLKDAPPPPTIIRSIGDCNRHLAGYKLQCGCTPKHEGLTTNDLNWWESENKD